MDALRGEAPAPPVVVGHLRQMTEALPAEATPPKDDTPDVDDGESDRVIEMLGRLRRADTDGRSIG